ncbi:HPF/RaiA family ribosome-associated protein, partial [Nonlabens mediterrranea]|nr:HPF/RaiA family ribosome-associated protein [Nonlabens mediterrranea]
LLKGCKSFEQCIDECAGALERQLKKRKEKQNSH